MAEKNNKAVTIWLFIVCILIILMISVGGFTRLTRSGLSIVEWNPISGVIPPIGEAAWEAEFAKYQQTPEFQKINTNMTLEGYKKIFYVEYIHRLIARFAGLVVVIPLFYFLLKGIIPWRKSFVYIFISILFAFQGFLGWYMVSSGLEDHPAVSHYRLTIHLLTAMFLLALTFWTALNHVNGFPQRVSNLRKSAPFWLSAFLITAVVIQISYGGFVAGLKAGWVSNTYPLMFGRWVPQGMFEQYALWWRNLFESPVTVHFIHRWFAFTVPVVGFILYYLLRKRSYGRNLLQAMNIFFGLIVVQILLGIFTVLLSVPLWIALAHQAVAMFLFLVTVYVNYGVVHERAVEVVTDAVTAVPQTGD